MMRVMESYILQSVNHLSESESLILIHETPSLNQNNRDNYTPYT